VYDVVIDIGRGRWGFLSEYAATYGAVASFVCIAL